MFEVGDDIAAGVRDWAHVQLFSPWSYDVDPAARRLLEAEGWSAQVSPDGAQLGTTYSHEPTSHASCTTEHPMPDEPQPRMRLGHVAWLGTSSVDVTITDPVEGVGRPVGHLQLQTRPDIAI